MGFLTSPRMTDGEIVSLLEGLAGIAFYELAGGEDKDISLAYTWEVWDISGIVPTGTIAVLVQRQGSGWAIDAWGVRENGSSLARILEARTFNSTLVGVVDGNRIIEIYCSSTSRGDFNIMGYWK